MMTEARPSTTLSQIYRTSLALLTDFYELSMAQAYWKRGIHLRQAVFHLIFRKRPFGGGFTIAAGLEQAIDYLENFRFDESDLTYLSEQKDAAGSLFFDPAFLEFLSDFRLDCSVYAVPEGTVIFPFEPLVRVQGPLWQAQILESALLNLFNFPTLIATKAARICISAQGDSVLEFGLRRAQGIDGAITASRAAYIGGCDSTSHVLAGKLFGIPVKGTHAHSFVMVFDDELTSFQEYAKASPNHCVFLVDTYDTLEGVRHAITVAKWLREQDKKFLGIRLDSGDLAYLSVEARKMLDEEGFSDAKIYASNELDETIIRDLKRQGAQIAVWGVGTNLVTSRDQPALDGVYKLSAIQDDKGEWKYKLKLSEQMSKTSNPGIPQIRRYRQGGEFRADMIYDERLGVPETAILIDPFDPTKQKKMPRNMEFEDLLVPIFEKGKKVYSSPFLQDMRRRTQEQLSLFHEGIKRFLHPHLYPVGMEKNLYEEKIALIQEIRFPTGAE